MSGVVLPDGISALEILYDSLKGAKEAFPSAFTSLLLPQTLNQFRKCYASVLPEFEAARLGSDQSVQIARHMCDQLQSCILYAEDGHTIPLHKCLTQEELQPVAAFHLHSKRYESNGGWHPEIAYQGQRFAGSDLLELAQLMLKRGTITAAAADSLKWLVENCLLNDSLGESGICLAGRKIAVLGAGAEMAPTRFYLEAGAHVLWLDTRPPPADWLTSERFTGQLSWPDCEDGGGIDLLTQPRACLATLVDFADGAPMDLCLYAYAPGQARELRLTSCMNALVNALPAHLIASVTMLVSPTTPTRLSAADKAIVEQRLDSAPVWQRVLSSLGLLGKGPGYMDVDSTQVRGASRTVVPIQGGSYQAAQYLCKVLMSETWVYSGQLNLAHPTAIRVSANAAAITRTRSLDHPVFAAAFGGAAAFGVETMTPRQSRRLNGLLAVVDWLREDMPEPGAVGVHGGILTMPYVLEKALTVAASIGFVRSPRLLKGLLKSD